VITIPLAVLGIWVSASLFIRAYNLYREGKREEKKLISEQKIQSKLLREREGGTEDA
jgi:hypothetical protein